jgi:hypothetical protein
LRGITQLVRFKVCFLEVTSLNFINLRVTRSLHDR